MVQAMSDFDRGIYHYLLNGEPTGIEERWQRHRQPSGQWLVNSSRRARGNHMEVDAWMDAGRVNRFELSWSPDEGEPVRAGYHLDDGAVKVRRHVGGLDPQEHEVNFPTATGAPLLSPLMRVFAGPVIARLLEAGGQGTVVVPSVDQPAATDSFLQPRVSTRRARLLETGVEVPALGDNWSGPIQGCRLCEYQGDQYGPEARFWLAEDDMLVRYQWRQSPTELWDVRLQRLEKEGGAG
jgi:hypothetical protein